MRLAKVKVDADFTVPCNPSILYPEDGGNLHCFTAVTACAVLDVLGPPYSDYEGRHCTYYNNYPFGGISGKLPLNPLLLPPFPIFCYLRLYTLLKSAIIDIFVD